MDEVDVEIWSGDQRVYEATLICEGAGYTVEDFAAGPYTVFLDAYNSRGEHLFAGDDEVEVLADQVADMGIVQLRRVGAVGTGDVEFQWLFDGERSCEAAGVDEIDVEVYADDSGAKVFETTTACVGGGLLLTEFAPGDYTIYVDGYTSGGEHLFEGSFSVTIVADRVVDAGDVTLTAVEDAPAPGEITLFWSFLYPADAAETDCARAGVTEVDVVLAPDAADQSPIAETFVCQGQAGGAAFRNLVAGTYTVSVRAYGRYDDADLLLYEKTGIEAVLAEGATQDLGDQELPRLDDAFGAIDVSWAPAGGTCADLSIDTVTFTVVRLMDGAEVVDETFQRACDFAFDVRSPYVPGSYRIDAEAGVFVGSTGPFTVQPNLTTTTSLALDAPPD